MPVPGEWSAWIPLTAGSTSLRSSSSRSVDPFDAVRAGPCVNVVEPGQIALVRRDDDLAATLRRDSVLLAVGVQRAASLHAQSRFERAWGVVDPRVDDAAVMSRLVCGDPILLLEDEDAEAVVAQQRLAGDRKPENARADDDEIR